MPTKINKIYVLIEIYNLYLKRKRGAIFVLLFKIQYCTEVTPDKSIP